MRRSGALLSASPCSWRPWGRVGCERRADEAVLVLVVTASGSPPRDRGAGGDPDGEPGSSSSAHYRRSDGAFITFPTTLSARLPASAAGRLTIEVRATTRPARRWPPDTGARSWWWRASARRRPSSSSATGCPAYTPVTPTADVGAQCLAAATGASTRARTCDTAIPPGAPGACPPSDCDDRVACTTDVTSRRRLHRRVRSRRDLSPHRGGDGCCPARPRTPRRRLFRHCGERDVDPGETCDTEIAGGGPGACPTIADCADGDRCASDLLASAGTCAAICVHYPVVPSERRPKGWLLSPGRQPRPRHRLPSRLRKRHQGVAPEVTENCDVGILPPAPGSCPIACDDGNDGDNRIHHRQRLPGRLHRAPIDAPVSGDGYCFPGASHSTDSDCPSVCGNGIIEPGEACEAQAVGDAELSDELRAARLGLPAREPGRNGADLLGALRDHHPNDLLAKAVTDGCCPAGCTSLTDADCSPSCGDGVVQPAAGEICDEAIHPGEPGACPHACADLNPCTEERLLGAGTCPAICVFIPVRAFQRRRRLLPLGRRLQRRPRLRPALRQRRGGSPAERCDNAAVGSCPTACPPSDACTPLVAPGRGRHLQRDCVPQPITACADGDGCCPAGCTSATDADCPAICGNRVIDTGELCDPRHHRGAARRLPLFVRRRRRLHGRPGRRLGRGLLAGLPAPPGHRLPRRRQLLPPGCTNETDADCDDVCGDGKVGAAGDLRSLVDLPDELPRRRRPLHARAAHGDPQRVQRRLPARPDHRLLGERLRSLLSQRCGHGTDSDC